ncbi:hypothetical protein LOR_63c15820 [Legionella oakridgensis RV-2-2007]|nr:hypothetical protein LOR_63c15820 [Legionella oakridgensis RV-2-2007]
MDVLRIIHDINPACTEVAKINLLACMGGKGADDELNGLLYSTAEHLAGLRRRSFERVSPCIVFLSKRASSSSCF